MYNMYALLIICIYFLGFIQMEMWNCKLPSFCHECYQAALTLSLPKCCAFLSVTHARALYTRLVPTRNVLNFYKKHYMFDANQLQNKEF